LVPPPNSVRRPARRKVADDDDRNGMQPVWELLRVISARKWLVLLVVVGITGASLLYQRRLPSIYSAETTLIIRTKQRLVVRRDKVVPRPENPVILGTQLRLLQTPQTMRGLVIKQHLYDLPGFVEEPEAGSPAALLGRMVASVTGNRGFPVTNSGSVALPNPNDDNLTPEQSARADACARSILERLSVRRTPGADLVVMRFQHSRPAWAKLVVDAVAQEFAETTARQSAAATETARDDAAKDAAEIRRTIDQLEAQRLTLLQSQSISAPDSVKGDHSLDRLKSLAEQVFRTDNSVREARANYAVAAALDDPLMIPSVRDDPAVLAIQTRLADLRAKRDQLSVNYTDEHPQVVEVDAQIAHTEEALSGISDQARIGLRRGLETAQREQDAFSQAYQQEWGRTQSGAAAATKLELLDREIAINGELFEKVVQRQFAIQSKLRLDRDNGRVTIVAPASLPVNPIGPQRTRALVIAFLLSVVLGVGLAFVLERMNTSLRSRADVERFLKLPALGVIPFVFSELPPQLARTERRRIPRAMRSPRSRRQAALSEAFRYLRISMLNVRPGRPPRVIMVTSAHEGEGKSTVAINLALALARNNAQVLLVDCDLRRPYHGLDEHDGVTNFLTGGGDLPDLIREHTDQPNLAVLASGPLAPNPADLLASSKMHEMLGELSGMANFVIIDTPPTLLFTDARLLAAQVDGVLLVARSGITPRGLVHRARQYLDEVNATILGVVLNGVGTGEADGASTYEEAYAAAFTPTRRVTRMPARQSSLRSNR
jgi:capsular exopolysaccharide synthesis family protein